MNLHAIACHGLLHGPLSIATMGFLTSSYATATVTRGRPYNYDNDDDEIEDFIVLKPERKTTLYGPDRQKIDYFPPDFERERIRQVNYNFASDLPSDSLKRVLLLLKKTEERKIFLDESDAFVLKDKMVPWFEKGMLEGTFLRIVPESKDRFLDLVELAKEFEFKLVAYSPGQLLFFDLNTRKALSPFLYITIGIGIGVGINFVFRRKRARHEVA